MKWTIRLTHEDDQDRAITCQYIIMQEMLDMAVEDFRIHAFKQMVKQIEAKLKENT
jgi:hypothetical protein